LCIHVGGREVLRDQVLAFAEKAKASGVPVELLVGEDMVHVWHAFAGLQPDADEAIANVGAFLRAHAPG
jgi:acetyl esterase/lipase